MSNSTNHNDITPSIDDIMSAVNNGLYESTSIEPISEETAHADDSVVKNKTESVNSFNASQWYLQNYPIADKKKTAVNEASNTIDALTKTTSQTQSSANGPTTKNCYNGFGIALAIIAIIAIIAVIIYLVSVSGTISSYDSAAYDGGYVADVNSNEYLHLNQPINLNIGVNELIYMYYIPDSSGNYNVYSYGQTDTIARIYDNNGSLVGTYDDGNGNGNFNFNIYLYEGEEYTFEFAAYAPGGDTTIKIIKG